MPNIKSLVKLECGATDDASLLFFSPRNNEIRHVNTQLER
jgi:hypothetical protein